MLVVRFEALILSPTPNSKHLTKVMYGLEEGEEFSPDRLEQCKKMLGTKRAIGSEPFNSVDCQD